MTDIERVHERIDQTWESDFLILKDLIAQQSVSTENRGVRECSVYIRDLLESFGVSATVYETDGFPLVYGERQSRNHPDAPTILFYGHYDVMPAGDLAAWKTDPFTATIVDGVIYGRGVADCKGQWIAHLIALRAYLEVVGDIPVNLKFCFEGDEELGSPSIRKFVESHLELLNADLVYTADSGMHPSGRPYVLYGVRGNISMDLSLRCADKDNHSGHAGGVIREAVWEMIRVLASMYDEEGRVTIQGFYDDIVPPTEYDRHLIDLLPFDAKEYEEIFGIREMELDRDAFFERLMFRPTLSINGIHGGYTGPGPVTIIPGEVRVKMNMRLAHKQDPDKMFRNFEAHVHAVNPDVTVTWLAQMPSSRTQTDLPIAMAVARAVKEVFGCEPVAMPLVGATGSKYIWTDILKQPSRIVPYANADENNHLPNENITLACWRRGPHVSAQVYCELGKLKAE